MISALGSSPTVLDGLAALTRVGVGRSSRPLREAASPAQASAAPREREADRVELSPAARGTATVSAAPAVAGTECDCDEGPDGLTDDERAQVRDLEQRDREVRSHEMAHKAAGGAHAGGASYSYQTGPNGQRYAVGGSVPIDVSAEGDPEATIRKMQQVRRAALAPSEPSSADRAVAAKAQQAEQKARAEQREQKATGDKGAPARTAYEGATHRDEPHVIDVTA